MIGGYGFQEHNPKTGSGKAQPKGTRMFTGMIKVIFRSADGKKIPPAKPPKRK